MDILKAIISGGGVLNCTEGFYSEYLLNIYNIELSCKLSTARSVNYQEKSGQMVPLGVLKIFWDALTDV